LVEPSGKEGNPLFLLFPFSSTRSNRVRRREILSSSTSPSRVGEEEISSLFYSVTTSRKEGNPLFLYSNEPSRREGVFLSLLVSQTEWEGGKSSLPLLGEPSRKRGSPPGFWLHLAIPNRKEGRVSLGTSLKAKRREDVWLHISFCH